MNKFKIGDKVVCTNDSTAYPSLKFGKEYEVEKLCPYASKPSLLLKGVYGSWWESRFELALVKPSTPPSKSALRLDAPGQGVKGDAGKPDMSLLSSIWLFGVADVLTYGSKKRGAHNWRKGLAITRLCSGALRHIFQFLKGEDIDRDDNCPGCQAFDKDPTNLCPNHSNKHHLDCAACNLMFARELLVTRPDLDDRYKIEPSKGVDTK